MAQNSSPGVGKKYDTFFDALHPTVKSEPQDPPLFLPPIATLPTAPDPPERSQPSTSTGVTRYSALAELVLPAQRNTQPTLHPPVKSEPNLDVKPQMQLEPRGPLLPDPTHSTFHSAEETKYTPERALTEGVEMAKTLGSYLQQIDLSSQLREEVWLRDIEKLKSQGSPRTMIAVCGATGAGKSSLLNAVLDDNIVPTSGMRACTAVVTEISYHNNNSIAADVEFLALSEWKAELVILLEDLVDVDGNLKRLHDLRNDSGIAWHKMHAVYPHLLPEVMVRMKPEEIIASLPNIENILGTVRRIECPNSEEFATEIEKYIDSKDSKRGKTKVKDKERGKGKPKSKPKPKLDEPALWPLIRSVRVKCKSDVLKCGAVLVDLPGVADANLARSSIAKDYMKKCHCIWIAAPITRAVDDKTAKDLLGEAFRMQLMNGNYDDSKITFIATKTDDLSCEEVIRALDLVYDPELEELEGNLEVANDQADEWAETQKNLTKELKGPQSEVKQLMAIIKEHKADLKALKRAKSLGLKWTASGGRKGLSPEKRKRSTGGRSPKRRRTDEQSDQMDELDNSDGEDEDDEDEDEVDETEEEEYAKVEDALTSDVIVIDSDSSDDVIILSDSDTERKPKSTGGGMSAAQQQLEATIAKKEAKLSKLERDVTQVQKKLKEANANLNELKKELSRLQTDKNAYCSIKRNKYSTDVLKEDFRSGLRQFDQTDEEAKNPETFDPSKELRDYALIDLPVFTCSSRDYIRIKKQVKGDGGPTCFVKVEDTGIPALQQWCRQLTLSARQQSATSLLDNLVAFLHTIQSYVNDVDGVNAADRIALGEIWESKVLPRDYGNLGLTQAKSIEPKAEPVPKSEPPSRRASCRKLSLDLDPNSLDEMCKRAREIQAQHLLISRTGQRTGISSRLQNSAEKVVKACIARLKQAFRDGVEGRCQSGANKAKEAAIEISDAFAASMHWQSYRATLRRNGEYKSDLNSEFITPITREIAVSWAQLFDSDLFAPMEQEERAEIVKLLQEIETSAPPGLKDHCSTQIKTTLDEAQVVIATILQNLKVVMSNEQKEISRCLTPHIKNELLAAYHDAAQVIGAGSVLRQKNLFHERVEQCRNTMFERGINSLFAKLDAAAESVGLLLQVALNELSEKVEVSMSALWEIPDNGQQHNARRRELVVRVQAMLRQLGYWIEASKSATIEDIPIDAAENNADGEVDDTMESASDAEMSDAENVSGSSYS